MPEERAPELLTDVSLDSEPLKLGGQSIEDSYALKLVTQTFDDYENYRQMNHDTRWSGADAMYCSYMPAKVWEGTRVPKAALSNPLVFSHVETVLPILEQAVFGSDNEWFQTSPEPGGDPAEANAVKDYLLYLLEHDHDDYGKTARRELVMSMKSQLVYGNGAAKIYYDPTKKKPCVEWVDIRDLYVDPGCMSPDIDEARSVIQRCHYTVDELDNMRNQPGMSIPPREILSYFASNYRTANADRTKTNQEAFRGVNYVPGASDFAALPADRKVEVFIYYSKSRIIWVLGREWVAFNGPNPYRFIPFVAAPCYTYLGRFYAMSFADVLGDQQQYVSGLYNARLNELSLSINPPRIKKAGSTMTPSQERWYPGAVLNVTNPKEDVIFPSMQNSTQNVMGDIEYMLQMSEKITGANGVVAGTPRGGNVNRTATGVSSQSQGGSSRLYYLVKNIEDYLIVPMLYKLYKLVQFHTTPDEILQAIGQEGQTIQVGAKAFQAPVRFQMIAATRMLTRDKLMQLVPFLSQYYMNGNFLQQLHGMGATVDFNEFQRLVQDAAGTGRLYKLVRTMTQQEQQALNQPSPQAVAEQQTEQAKSQTLLQMEQMKGQTARDVANINHAPDPAEQQKAQQEMILEAQRARQDQQTKAAELQFEHTRKSAEFQQNTQAELAKLKLALAGKQSDMAMQEREHNLKLHETQEDHNQKLVHQEQQNRQKLQMQRLMMALKAQEMMNPPQEPASND